MSILPRRATSSEIYSTYKYDELPRDSIIHEGNLEYLSGENFLFKIPSFQRYFVVLTCFLHDNKENLVILYLYPEKTKNVYKHFQLEKNDKMNDQCQKLIKGERGLFFMELIINKTNKGEIFGTRSVPERKMWIEKFDEVISKLRFKPIGRSISDTHSSRPSPFPKECSFPARSDTINYTPFKGNETDGYLPPTQSTFIRRANSSLPTVQPMKSTDEDYEEATGIPFAEKKSLSWENIFYPNQKNDFGKILNDIGLTGVFLIRPQLNNSSASDHDYTLCVYDDGHIQKFGIHQSPTHQFLLNYRDNEPNFPNISELCQYYTTHPLHISSKEGLKKYLLLKYPYAHENSYY